MPKEIQKQSSDFPGISFACESVRLEFFDTKSTDPRVRAFALELALFAHQNDINLEVTQIRRSKKSQVAIYGFDKPSGHRELPARAVDFSVRNMTGRSISLLTEHFNAYLKIAPFYSLICHDVGAGKHLHLQVPQSRHNCPDKADS